jgi:diguanylate cyclase (GGDEF)-like protein
MERSRDGELAQSILSLMRSITVRSSNVNVALFGLYFGAAFGAVCLAGEDAHVASISHAGPLLVVFLLASFPVAVILLRHRVLSERGERQAAIAEAALDNMAQGLSMFDPSGRMITCNRQYRDLYGLPEHLCRKGSSIENIMSHQVALGICQGDIAEFRRVLAQTETHQCSELNLLDGRTIQIRRRTLENGNLVATHEDVTDQRTTAKRLSHLASHDPLTQLANRTQFRDKLNSALSSESSPFALHTIDLDCFKEINDTLGHPAGDAVLEAAAQRIRTSVREGDLVARLGGDEFAILQLVLWTPEDATALAGRLASDLAKPVFIDGTRVDVSASIGVALSTESKILPDTLMRMSDTALYCAKAAGRSTFRVYEPEMDLSLREKKRLEREIKAANPRTDFELYFQPILDVHRGEVASFEALIRWHHPVEGLILPDRFIVAAEESGAIQAIGNWAIHSACLEAMKWPKAIKVAVNVSPVQLRDPDFLDSIASAINSAGIAPHRLQVEITESVLLQDMDETLRVLERLKATGVGISVDDFGTGYASLSYLRKFPFDTLKIDQSFIREMANDGESLAIIESTLGLAHKLGMATVAEGVETVEQMSLLRAMNCSRVQGYLINRPHPASAVPAMLAREAVDSKDSRSASQLAA